MRRPFRGFSGRKEEAVVVPRELLEDLLAEMEDLAELKVLLAVFRILADRKKESPGLPRAVTWEELRQDEDLRAGLSLLGRDVPPEERLDRALERCVARGTLLHLVLQRAGHAESVYLVNTPANRKWATQAQEDPGRMLAGTPWADAGTVELERPSIFALYEQNIGLVPPILVDELEEAAQRYPPEWIQDAFREALSHNARNWRYVRSILQRWEREGRGERAGREEKPIDFEKYTRGEYADLFGPSRSQERPEREGEADGTRRRS
ncbi:MAG: DnaD domain-containing protein [Chloroflexia bacterium]